MTIRERLLSKFRDKKYRHTYIDTFTDAYIATQIKVLREQRKLDQTEFARLAGIHQSQVSAFEDVDNASWTVKTLKKIAKAFDLVLVVRFESFGKVLPDIGRLDRASLQRNSFDDDEVFRAPEEPKANPLAQFSAKVSNVA